MKRKLLNSMRLLLVAVLLGMGANVSWAETETYNFESFIGGLNGSMDVPYTSIIVKKINKQNMTLLADFNETNYSAHWRTNAAPYAFENTRFLSQGNLYVNRGNSYFLRNNGGGARYFSIMNLYVGDEVTLKITGTVTFVSTNAKVKSTDAAVSAGDAVISETTYVITDNGDLDLSIAKVDNNVYSGLMKVEITPVDHLTGPTITAVAANGNNRIVELSGGSTSEDGASISSYRYTTDGSIPSATKGTVYDAGTKITISETTTIKAVAISSTGKVSPFVTTEIEAGTTLFLNAPSVTINTAADFTKSGNLYYPKYTFTSDQASVLGNPDVTYTYTIAGVDNATANPTGFEEAKAGRLIVTVHADGYASTSAAAVIIKPYVLSMSWDFSDTDYELNSNWSLNNDNASMPGGTYAIKGKRYVPTSEAKSKTATIGTLFDGLGFSNRTTDGDYYYYVQGLGIGQVGGNSINNATVTVDGLTSTDYTVYKKYNDGNTITYNVVSGSNTWNLGKMSGTGAHVLHGIFVYSPATESQSGVIGTLDYSAESYSADYTLKAGETKVFTFQNHGKYDGANWDNWRIRVKQGEEIRSFTRADSWDQAGAGRAVTRGYLRSDDDGKTTYDMNNDGGWATFRADMTDALVVATLTYGTDGTLNITTTSSANGHIYYVDNTVTDLGTADLTVNISPCWSWVQLSSVEQTAIAASIGTYGYATFSSTYALDFTDVTGATAYIATSKSGDKINMQAITGKVAAGTGLVLKSTSGSSTTISIPVTSETGTTYNTESATKNYLFAISSDYNLTASGTGTNYVLSVQSGKVVFAPIGATAAPVTAGHAALWIPAVGARMLEMSFADDETTGISQIENGRLNIENSVYNLNGQRVTKPSKGLYIVGGKKVILK